VSLRLAVELRHWRRQLPDESRTSFDELDGTIDDLVARRRSRGGGD
jgi:hypothetical protein